MAKHRHILRLFGDEIMERVLAENAKLRAKVARSAPMSEEADGNGNGFESVDTAHLEGIEEKYEKLVRQRKSEQRAMKECEVALRRKEDEIYRLKAKLIGIVLIWSRRRCDSNSNAPIP